MLLLRIRKMAALMINQRRPFLLSVATITGGVYRPKKLVKQFPHPVGEL
jgi:hypothetical protein